MVVSDTSPLNYLAQIGLLELLPALYGEVLIPAAVARELGHPGAPVVVRGLSEAPPAWLVTRDPAALDATIGLGGGEVAAISLAVELRAERLLMDDRAAARAAAARGLTVAGTLTVLAEASERKLVELAEAIQRLRATNFRVSPEVVAAFLRLQGGQ
jgi:predicted nucleic acid-binding protein